MADARAFDAAHPDFSWTEEEKVRVLASYDPIFRIAARLPARVTGAPGKPRAHPEVVYVFYTSLLNVFGSNRKAASWIRSPHNWAWLRETWFRERGVELGPVPPCRSTCRNGMARMRAHLGPVLDEFRAAALAQAVAQGLLTGDASTMVDPPRSNVVVADGTVPKMRMKTTTYKRLRQTPRLRRDGSAVSVPEATKYTQGDGVTVMGQKFVVLSARANDDVNTRVILDVRHCPTATPGGEARVATDAILALREAAPALHGGRYDGAARGVHIDELVKAGITIVSPPHPGSSKPRFLKALACACGEEHYLGTEAGWLCLVDVLDDGTDSFVRLTDRKVAYVRRADSYVSYVTVKLPCGFSHRERVDQSESDKRNGFNRCEHLRQHPKDSPVYTRTYGWRSDAESDNNNLDSGLYRHRMIVDRADDQHLVVMGHALVRNAMSAAVTATRAIAPPASAA